MSSSSSRVTQTTTFSCQDTRIVAVINVDLHTEEVKLKLSFFKIVKLCN